MLRRDATLADARWAWALAGLLVGAVAASAQVPDSPKREEAWAGLARKAQVVVVGKVLSVESRWEARQIVSTARVQPLELLKDLRPGDRAKVLEVRFLGGRVGPWAQDFSHELTLIEGETAVFFLGPPPQDQAAKITGLHLLGEGAKVPLLRPDDPPSRLTNNRRLASRLEALRVAVKAGQ